MKWLTNCLYCGGKVYRLQDNRVKCSLCHKKIAIKKINRILLIAEGFANNESALAFSKRNHFSYISVQNNYHLLRKLCTQICEREYEALRHLPCEYEEYFYLEKSKRTSYEAVFDAQNFLTFDYDKHIYTLLMPSLQQYKSQFIEDNLSPTYIQEFNAFKRNNKIIKISKKRNNIVEFWEYFERTILTYKGVKSDNFIYFLKECELKYNHKKEDIVTLLISEYFTL